MKKLALSWDQVEGQVLDLCRQLQRDQWTPDYVVGITRGGLLPANMISQWFNCRMETLKVKLRDCEEGEGPESNLWMAEDAFGSVPYEEQETYKSRWDVERRSNILVVDDINDTGATFAWIKQDWQSSCLPNESTWDTIWHKNVRFAVLVDNQASDFTVDYSAVEINKQEDPCWVDFPWEGWWK